MARELPKSPFPGMDPFLEGYLWPDFHASYAQYIKRQLMPLLPENLIAIIEITIQEEAQQDDATLILRRPDVTILDRNDRMHEPLAEYGQTPPTIVAPAPAPITYKQHTLIVKQVSDGSVLLAIEVLSPFNKRGEGLKTYRSKRQEFYRAGINLLELDLLRGGQRPYYEKDWPAATYAVQLLDTDRRTISLWALDLDTPLPNVELPLGLDYEPVPLRLQEAFADTYAHSGYHRALRYRVEELKPPVQEREMNLVQEYTGT